MIRDAQLIVESGKAVTATASSVVCTNVIDLKPGTGIARPIFSGTGKLKAYFKAHGAASGNTNGVTVNVVVSTEAALTGGTTTTLSTKAAAAIANDAYIDWEIQIPVSRATKAQYLGIVYAVTGSGAAFTITEAGFVLEDGYPTNLPGAAAALR